MKEIALENNQFYINKRWLGGTLTNWKTISNSIKRLDELEIILNDESTSQKLSKKELLDLSREKDKLVSNIGGIRNLDGKPDLLVIFDVVKDKLAVLEAKKNKKNVNVGIRLNPNVDAKTLSQISTGKKENKFGVGEKEFLELTNHIKKSKNLNLK